MIGEDRKISSHKEHIEPSVRGTKGWGGERRNFTELGV
jgi:hypothetical protein